MHLWLVTETQDELAELVTGEDEASAESFSSPLRRIERLAWRAALRSTGERAQVAYLDTGAPYLVGSDRRISVSHSPGAACVLIAESDCAVDMERADRDCAGMTRRFVSEGEMAVVADEPNRECALWCMKEALYKFAGRRGLDFRRDIRITGRVGQGRYSGVAGGKSAVVSIVRCEGYLLAVIV